MRSCELLADNPEPSEEEIRWGISGNLCRCTGYNNIVEAAKYAAKKIQEEKINMRVVNVESPVAASEA